MNTEEHRFEIDLNYQGKEFRISSRHQKMPGEDCSRIIDIFDSEGLYGFIQLYEEQSLETADAYSRIPGEEGLRNVEPTEFKDIYEELIDRKEVWDKDLTVQNPRETAEPYKRS